MNAEPHYSPAKGGSPRPPRASLSRNHALGVLAATTLAAIVVPGSRAGLGLALAALAVIGCTVGAIAGRDRWQAGLLALAAILALTPLFRDAAWLVTVNLIISLVLCAVALSAEHSWRSLATAPANLLRRLPPAPGAVLRGTLVAVPTGGGDAVGTALRGTAIAGGLIVVFGALFASADGAFAEIAQAVAPRAGSLGDLPARVGVGLLTATLAGGLALTAAAPAASVASPGRERRGLAPLEWGIPLAALTALFAIFVAVQFVVLFGGGDRVLETSGLTYAEYARDGFGQLLLATALVLAVVAIARGAARAETGTERLVLRLLLGALCLLALVVVASALHRLDLYVDAFGATRARLLAATACAALGGFLALLGAAVLTARDGWLPRTAALGAGLIALVLTLTNPDALIAKRNVERYEREGRIDVAYASSLSADATPALAALPRELADRVLATQRVRLGVGDGPFGLNRSRERARSALADLGLGGSRMVEP